MQKIILNTLNSIAKALDINIQKKCFISQIEEAALLLSTANRVIITGMGKSGLIAQKVSATLTSTGTPSIYLHPSDALHGDMGHVDKTDIILAYSHSGETQEIIALLPHLKLLGGKIISICGKENSTLIQESDFSIHYHIKDEGCPLGLAPMSSTSMSIIIGDALAAALIEIKQFKKDNFSKFHPAGSLGKKLLTKVKDVMHSIEKIYLEETQTFGFLIQNMVSSNLGAVVLYNQENFLTGIITDGDIKRYLNTDATNLVDLFQKTAKTLMTVNPCVIDSELLIEEAMKIMHEHTIYTLPVIDHSKKVVGLIRMHDILL